MDDNNNKNQNNDELDEELDNQDENNDSGNDGKVGDDKGSKDKNDNTAGSLNGKTFTQAQVTRMMTKEKNQGRNTVYKELGIDPKDTKAVAQFKAFLEAQKTEEQKVAEKQSAEKAALAEANQKATIAEAKAEAMMFGIKKNYVEDAVALAMSKMTENSDLKTILGELKTKYPIWFEAGEDDEDGNDSKDTKGKTGQKGTGSSIKNNGKDKKGETGGLGARLAAQRTKNASKKSSYWG